MTCARRLAANRANAQRSTGPRTAKGKARASANARRHGLTVAAPEEYAPPEIARLAAAYRYLLNDPEAAQRAAAARVHLARIRSAEAHLLQLALARLTLERPGADQAELEALAIILSQGELAKLREYERKARSRLKRALRTGE